MKKAGFLVGLCCATGLGTVILAQNDARIRNIVKESMSRQQAEKEKVNAFFTAKLYDSVISYCSANRASNVMSYDDAELAFATAYWYRGDKTTAYQYVQNAADYTLKLNGGGGSPFAMLSDYSFGPALASDTFLEQMIIVKVSDYYKAMEYYPDRSTGLQLMLADYRSQKLIQRHAYELQNSQSPEEKKQLNDRYEQEKDEIDSWFVSLLKENKKIYDRHEVGPANEKQFSMIRNFHKREYFEVCKPLLYQAMLHNEADPDVYVDAIVWEEKLKDNIKDLSGFKDSLCRIYKCKISVWDSTGLKLFSYATGDTVYMRKDTAYLQDNKGGIMKHLLKAPAPSSPVKQ
jgi:hypothetical protein